MNENNKLDFQELDAVSGGNEGVLMVIYCKHCRYVDSRGLERAYARGRLESLIGVPCCKCGQSDIWGVTSENAFDSGRAE